MEKRFNKNLSNEELEIAGQITIRIGIKIQKFINDYNAFEKNPQKYIPHLNKAFYKILVSENLYSAKSNDLLNPTKIKKEMLNDLNIGFDYNNYELQDGLSNYIYSNKDINESLLSKVLSEFTVKNILIQVMKNKEDFRQLDRKECSVNLRYYSPLLVTE